MKIHVKTLKGTIFEVEVKPEDTVADVKKTIETTKGADTYPAAQQVLINQGKVLKDETTFKANKVTGYVMILLRKNKGSPAEDSTTSIAPTLKAPQTSAPPSVSTKVATSPPAVIPAPTLIPSSNAVSDIFIEVSSNLFAGNNLEIAIQQILHMGGGTWDRDTVVRALRDALSNPEYLHIGIPESAEAPPVSRSISSGQAANVPAQSQQPAELAPLPSTGPNTIPLDLFPQVLANSPRVQNPRLLRLIQENQASFLRKNIEPIKGGEGDLLGQLAGPIPQAIRVTPEERESIERLKAMGFDQDLVLQVFFACDKDEEIAANFLFDHIHEFQ